MGIKKKIRFKDALRIVLSLAPLLVFSGCQKVINVDLNEGLINDRGGPYSVTITKSGSYFNQPVLPSVSGADVTITDNTGITDTLRETTPGIYVTSRTKGT